MAESIIAENPADFKTSTQNYLHDLPHSVQITFQIICNLALERGYCWAFNKTLATMRGVSIATIKRHITILIEAGILTCRHVGHDRRLYLNEPLMSHQCASSEPLRITKETLRTTLRVTESSVMSKKTQTPVEHPERNGVQESPKDTKPPHSILSQEGKIPQYPYDTVQGSPRPDVRDVSTAQVQSASCEAGETIERGCAEREGENVVAEKRRGVQSLPCTITAITDQRFSPPSKKQSLAHTGESRALVGVVFSETPRAVHSIPQTEAYQSDTDTLTEERTHHADGRGIRGDSQDNLRKSEDTIRRNAGLLQHMGRGNQESLSGKNPARSPQHTIGRTFTPEVDTLIANGVSPAMASKIAERFDAHAIQCAIRYARQQQARGRCRDVTAFLVASLLKGWSMPLMDCTPESIEAQHRKAREAAYVPRIAEKREPAVIQGDMPPMALLRAKYHEGCAKAAGGGIGV